MFFNVNLSIAGTGIHGYNYYDTRTRHVNMQILKILVPVTRKYPFTISISYPLWDLSRSMDFFDISRRDIYVHSHTHSHTQLKKSRIPHIHTQSM